MGKDETQIPRNLRLIPISLKNSTYKINSPSTQKPTILWQEIKYKHFAIIPKTNKIKPYRQAKQIPKLCH
jgi:hypothetical protein